MLFRVLCLLMLPSFLMAEVYRTELPEPLNDAGWELSLNKNGVRIFTRDWPGSSFVAVKTVQIINAPIESVLRNFLDVETFPEWVKDLKEGRVIDPLDDQDTRTIYLRIDMPWPLQDRDAIIKQQIFKKGVGRGIVISENYAGDRLPQVDGVMRIPRLVSEYHLIPLENGGVQMVWQGHNEPGGIIPPFLVNWMIESVMYESCLTMRERFEAPEFQRLSVR